MLHKSIQSILLKKYQIDVQSAETLHGGDINDSYKIIAKTGPFFIKTHTSAPRDFFEKEALGLKNLRNCNTTLRIPDVIAFEPIEKNTPGFLLLEYIPPNRTGDFTLFGQQLAQLHQTKSDKFGLPYNNYIGRLDQPNTFKETWSDFFINCRIEPLLKKAIDTQKFSTNINSNWDRLASKLADLLPKTEPSLLHGDLWSGNFLFDDNQNAVLIDPAIYYGHPEVDLALTKLFGGFPNSFYEGYESVNPLEPGFNNRLEIYNLYPLLVHAILFGGYYCQSVQQILQKF